MRLLALALISMLLLAGCAGNTAPTTSKHPAAIPTTQAPVPHFPLHWIEQQGNATAIPTFEAFTPLFDNGCDANGPRMEGPLTAPWADDGLVAQAVARALGLKVMQNKTHDVRWDIYGGGYIDVMNGDFVNAILPANLWPVSDAATVQSMVHSVISAMHPPANARLVANFTTTSSHGAVEVQGGIYQVINGMRTSIGFVAGSQMELNLPTNVGATAPVLNSSALVARAKSLASCMGNWNTTSVQQVVIGRIWGNNRRLAWIFDIQGETGSGILYLDAFTGAFFTWIGHT